jgi:hypothetical protein
MDSHLEVASRILVVGSGRQSSACSVGTPSPRRRTDEPGSVGQGGSTRSGEDEPRSGKKLYSKRYLWIVEKLNNHPERVW